MTDSCPATTSQIAGTRWTALELTFTAALTRATPYVVLDFWALFTNEHGETLRRPGFWDGGQTWRLRFAPPARGNRWTFETFCSDGVDAGLHRQTGSITVTDYLGADPFRRHGFLRPSPGRRNFVHADGTPFLLVGDTPWSLPFRGTVGSVTHYARHRQARGFNAALLMSVQSDQEATGPRDRTLTGGFAVGFEDLARGHLNEINPEYFQTLDALTGILLTQGIVPVYNPVFQGYGWKGGKALGNVAVPAEYVRYQKYLVARYGAQPAIWLVSADATGRDPMVAPAGESVEQWDPYGQPTGIHYNPYDDHQPHWSKDPYHGWHHNRLHQDAPWLDFQWAQTGHEGHHQPHKVERMYENLPTKAAANGEPTYERMGAPERATGWWQGHEAWQSLMAGGTLGHVYGAGGLWNWKLSASEPGWAPWCDTAASWSEAIEFEGSRYVGYLSRAFAGLDFADMERRPDLANGQPLLAVPGKFYLSYLPEGGDIRLTGVPPGLTWKWFNPRTGDFGRRETVRTTDPSFTAPDLLPWVLIVGNPR